MRIKLCLFLAAIVSSGTAGAGIVDNAVNAELTRLSLKPSAQADPATFVRRVFLTATDRLPSPAQTAAYLANPDKAALVDSLLSSDGFVRKQVLKWGDLLRIKSEFPSCMWPNAVQAYNKWLTEEFRANTPYNEFVRHLLDCTGSNFRVPQINFYRAGSDRRPEKFASDIALLFLGRRSAPAAWSDFFCQVKFKSTMEWKEEILCLDPDAEPGSVTVNLGDGAVTLRGACDFRQPFIAWLTRSDHRELARVYVNRFWFWMMGEGLIMPVDDVEGRSPSCPALLDALTDFFISSGWNVRALAREILLSDAFSRSSVSEGGNAADRTGFSHFRQSRLTAEQICDGICDITEVYDKYSSRAPEPFTNYPDGTHSNEVCDGTVTTPQLDIFGRPSRDSGLESNRDNSVNSKQMLYLLNSTTIQTKLEKSKPLAALSTLSDRNDMIDAVYMRVLSRHADGAEKAAVRDWSSKYGCSASSMIQSLAWALLNTDEFLFLN